MTVAEALHWRYATKRMNGQTIPQEQLDRILEAARLAPSSYGLQPYTVLVIGDQALRERIKPVAAGQLQITESSHLLVFAAWDPVREEHVNQLIRLTAEERGMSPAELEGYKNTIKDVVRRLSPAERYHWAAKQAYLALGTALVAAAAERIDASPMEGFDPASLDQLLGLKERGLRSVVLLALGYRDNTTDWLAPFKKVRWPREKLFVHLTEADVLRAVEPAVAERSLAFK